MDCHHKSGYPLKKFENVNIDPKEKKWTWFNTGLFFVHIARHFQWKKYIYSLIGTLESSHFRFLAPSFSLTLTNEGFYELTWRPLLTQAVALVSLLLNHSQVKRHFFFTKFTFFVLSPDNSVHLDSFLGWHQHCAYQQRVTSQLKRPFIAEGRQGGRSTEKDETRFKFPNLRLYFLK